MMVEPASIATLKEYRYEVLWWEICSILHDIGKLSYDFHDYRQNWWSRGWGTDPHDHNWLTRDKLIPSGLRKFFESAIPLANRKVPGILSVKEAVHEHTNRHSTSRLVKILAAGDGTDSRYDRNNPLISNEQTSWDGSTHPPYRANVYGHERKVDLPSLDPTRTRFYGGLWKLFEKYANDGSKLSLDDYWEFKRLCRECFEQAMSDTTRPSNDTALWEHVYGVACVSKAVHAEEAAGAPREKLWPVPFDLYGVGVDAWKWCGQGERIGDVTGRKELIEIHFTAVKKLIEFDVAAGNCIYEDDGIQVYLIGQFKSQDGEVKVKEWLDEQVATCFGSELGAATVLEKEVNSTTGVVRVIDALRKKVATPSNWQPKTLVMDGARDADLCPVCRVRRVGGKQENRGVCGECAKRRSRIRGFEATGDPKAADETPMLGEIADRHGRVALVVARFGLRDWLSGQMTRSCLITEPDGIERMGKIVNKVRELEPQDVADFREWLSEKPKRGYEELHADLKAVYLSGNDDSYALSVFARSPVGYLRLRMDTGDARLTWDSDLREFGEDCPWLGGTWDKVDRLLNAVCAKTPTPSTTLDIWSTTKEFFEQAVKGDDAWIRTCLERGARGWMEIDPIPGWLKPSQRRSVEVKGFGDEFLFHDGRLWIVQNRGLPERIKSIELIGDGENERAKGVRVTRVASAGEKAGYWPYRTLTASPDVLMALMPADRAPEFTRLLAEKYREHFGKVAGRLPLGIGNIFFPKHLPMFSVLDTAWRVVDNFRKLQEGPWVERPFQRPATVEGLRLGNGERDSFHSYVITKDRACVKSAFRTAAGWIAHREDLEEGTTILERPNLYDGIVLGGSGDRLNLNLTGKLDSKESPEERTITPQQEAAEKLFARTGQQRVGLMTLEEFEECTALWNDLNGTRKEDRPLRNLWFALEARRASWTGGDKAGGEAALLEIGKALGRHYLGEDWARLESAFERGVLEKTLQLHWSILKERLAD